MPKYQFKLDINRDDILSKYGQNASQFASVTHTTTPIENLPKPTGVISFLDDGKKIHNCMLSTCVLDKGQEYHCFWCRHTFDSYPIGCPVNFIPDQAVKHYYSQTSKDFYTIKENIHKDKEITNTDTVLKETRCYETDGIFCSFNCVQAYISDNSNNPLYKPSKGLLLKIYKELVGEDIDIINPSPHWRTLKAYGGFQDINAFRRNLNNTFYEFQGTVKNRFFPNGMLYEKHIKF